MLRRRVLIAVSASVATLVAGGSFLAPLQASGPSVSISTIDGQVSSSRHPATSTKKTVTVVGQADIFQPVLADAGDSAFADAGTPITVTGLSGGGSAPYTYSWSYQGSSTRFANPAKPNTTFDTTGLPQGPLTLDFQVTDSRGKAASGSVKEFIAVPVTSTVLSATATTAGPSVAGVTTDEESTGKRYPFTVAPNTTALHLELSWGQSYKTPAVNFRGYDLTVDDPSTKENGNKDAATFNEPEQMDLTKPAPGAWGAIVTSSVNVPDTYQVKAVATVTPPNTLPTISTPSPVTFQTGKAQKLTATVAGRGPLTTAWDTDQDGVFETPGTSVTTNFPVGTHLVTVKTTDADGYTKRVVVGVRVVAPGSTGGTAALVVVGVTDSGINLYHDDFSAKLYPDKNVLALTNNFTKHPSEYIPGYPAATPALPITLGQGYLPDADKHLFTRENIPLNKLFWVPGTKVIGARDGGDSSADDVTPILDDTSTSALGESGHGTASASVAVGNVFGFCQTCLLVFNEDINSDPTWIYSQKWIDIVSNSYGPIGDAGDLGTTGLFGAGPSMPSTAADRGQIGLYAAGNGVENAFMVPEQTYLPSETGPSWVIRVGADWRDNRKPIIGTGKPVDISSWGLGNIPAADYQGTSVETNTRQHGGTSAATPLTAGVFGTVLGRIRSALGDAGAGQRTDQPGVIATGTPIPSSPYLKDGVLTRAELQDVVEATAEHDPGTDASVGWYLIGVGQTTPPYTPAQFMLEGYGIAEPASAARAVDVLLGKAPRPDRANEDSFFAADHALRDQLWGGWNGGGTNSATSASGAAPVRPFDGITGAQVRTWPGAFSTLLSRAPLFPVRSSAPAGQSASSSPASPTVAITDPAADAVIDPTGTTALPVSGTATFPAPKAKAARFYPKWPYNGTACGTEYLGRSASDPDAGCSSLAQPAGPVATQADATLVTESYALGAPDAPALLGADLPVSGSLFYSSKLKGQGGVNPAHEVDVQLVAKPSSSDAPVVIGHQVVSGTDVSVPGVSDKPTEYPFSFAIDQAYIGRRLSGLSLDVTTTKGTLSVMVRQGAASSFVDLPFGDVAGRKVTLGVDGGAPVAAALAADGSWTASVPTGGLADGVHTLTAVAKVGTSSSSPASTGIDVRRSPTPRVQVAIVPTGAQPAPTGWVDAVDSSPGRDYSAWTAKLDASGLTKGRYDVYARLVLGAVELSRTGPAPMKRG